MEICINNAWGTVCDTRFGLTDATIVCRTLGFNFTEARLLEVSDFGIGTGPIFLDDLSCEEDDETLLDCSSAALGLHACTHDQDVAVRCVGMLVWGYGSVCSSHYSRLCM